MAKALSSISYILEDMRVLPSGFVQNPEIIISGQPCFSAIWATVKPLAGSAFSGFGSVAIFAKWSDKVLCGALDLFAIRSSGYISSSSMMSETGTFLSSFLT